MRAPKRRATNVGGVELKVYIWDFKELAKACFHVIPTPLPLPLNPTTPSPLCIFLPIIRLQIHNPFISILQLLSDNFLKVIILDNSILIIDC